MLFKYIYLFAMMLSVGWFVSSPDWEPVITFLGLFVAFLINDREHSGRRSKESKTSKLAQRDKKLFKMFLKTLPSKGSVQFLREHNMAGFSFKRSELSDLQKLYYEWCDAEHEFSDTEMETKRKELHGCIGEYLNYLSINTWPTHISGFQSVPSEWELEQPTRFTEVVEKLHSMASTIVEQHQELVRFGNSIQDA